MIYADVKTINRFQRRRIEHGNDCVIGIRCGINHPQSIIVHIEVYVVELSGVEIVAVVGGCEIQLFHACKDDGICCLLNKSSFKWNCSRS